MMPYPGGFFGGDSLWPSRKAGVKFFEFLGVKTLAEARKLDAVYIRDVS